MIKSINEKIALEGFKVSGHVFIAGGGPVGLMLAIAMAKLGAKVTLAEQSYPVDLLEVEPSEVENLNNSDTDSSFDGRVLALNYGSMLFLKKLGLWENLAPMTTEIKSVHVSQKGFLGITHLQAAEMNVPALGYSILAKDLGRVLWQSVQATPAIKLRCPAKLESLEQLDKKVSLILREDKVATHLETEIKPKTETLEVDLVVGADGTNSTVRQLLGLALEEKNYDAFGVIAKIETEKDPKNWAYERFTQDGPVALLPMGGHFHKAVLVCSADEIDSVKALSDEAFMDLFASKMGERLGAYTRVSERVYYPLKETYVPQMFKGRALLMGNASHTQHPVAAQGLNLGIADIQAFMSLLETEHPIDIGEASLLETYAAARHAHHQKIMGLTDGLIELFQAPSPVVGHIRGIGLMAMQAMPGLRKRFSRMSMGVSQ